MDFIEMYFKEKAKNVNFIELKDYIDMGLGGEDNLKDLPLPLVSDVLAEGISTGKMAEELSVELILDGMIYLIGTDKDFEGHEEYKRIIKGYSENMDDYIFFKGLKFLEEDSLERADIYFRSLVTIYPKHLLGRFNYGLSLERIGQEMFKEEKAVKGEAFIKQSTLEFETVLDIDESYPLAYYKLGYHYNYSGQNLKAKLMWEKYIKLDDDEMRLAEVREQIAAIEDDVTLESALTYLSYNRHEEALDLFLKLIPRHEKWWELRYLIGATYAGLDQGEKAVEEYYIALELNEEIEDVYNELGIELIKLDRLEEAIEVYSRGIENLQPSYKLFFNRGLAYLQLGDLNSSYIDIGQAYNINPIDENVKEMKEYFDNIREAEEGEED